MLQPPRTLCLLSAAALTAAAQAGTPYLVAAGRGPIPAEGESWVAPIPAPRLDAPPAEPPGPAVAWSDAPAHVGERVTVEGRVVDTYNHRGRVCFLNFNHDRADRVFYLTLFPEAFAGLPQPPEVFYLDKAVRVTGEVTLHKGRPNLEVRHPGRVEVVEDGVVRD